MNVNVELLKRSIAASGKTKEAVAREMGIDYSTFSRKMNSQGLTFSVGQMHKIVDVLGISGQTASEIFLSNNSH